MPNHPASLRLHRRAWGNVTSEYALIGAIVLGASCVALANIGDTTSILFENMLGTKPQQTTKVTAPPKGNGQVTPPPQQGSGVHITLSDGTTIHLPEYPQDLTSLISTAGANGATDVLANTIKALAQQLLDKGAITKAEFNNLIALSNQAHRIASVEKVIESVAQNSSTPSEFSSGVFKFEGNTYNLDEITALIGFDNNSMDPNAVVDHLTDPTASPEISAFQNLFNKALQSGALDDPVLRDVVQTLSEQILSLSDLTNIAAYHIADYSAPPSSMTQNITSNLTDQKATGICGAGAGVDSGVQCSAG